ncbi:MAG: hypothetical protein K2X81_04605 [Candidatus Obscuribacterales bacterium]|nr:hypothetical protein [Candidatus Obscuribacterales bacterium]
MSMNTKNNENNQPKVLLLEAPKHVPRSEEASRPVEANKGISEAPSDPLDARKYGQNTGNLDRDPVTGQFLPGNPGKPLGARHFSTMFRDYVREAGAITKDGQKVGFDKLIVKKMVSMAVDGNLKAAGMVLDRVDGKVPQTFEVNKTERIGILVMTQQEIEDHESIFKRKYAEPNTKNNNTPSDGARNEDTPRVTEGSAYETH